MEYRKMEKLGVSTSLLGFGCMRQMAQSVKKKPKKCWIPLLRQG